MSIRPTDDIVSLIHDPRYGVVFTNGEGWKKQRKTFARLFKSTGFKKSHLETVIEHIWPKLKLSMTIAPSVVIELQEPMEPSENESLHRMELTLMELLVLIFADKAVFPGGSIPEEYLQNFNISRTCGIQWIEQRLWYKYPFLRLLSPQYSGFTWIKEAQANTHRNLDGIISLHKGAGVKRIKSSYIDSYLKEAGDIEEETSNSRKELIASLKDFLLGSDGVTMGFFALLYCLARNPHVQEDMRREILSNLSADGPKDKSTLPYCWAVVLETLRYIPQTGYGTPHHCTADQVVGNFTIPAGTDVYPNLAGILRNTEYWDAPNTFNPRRFIDPDMQCHQPKHWIPFEIGPRACPGGKFAMDVLFMLGVKMVTELELSFGGFTNEKASANTKLKFYGMALIHHYPFKLIVKKFSEARWQN